MKPETLFLCWALFMGCWVSVMTAFKFIQDARDSPFLWWLSPPIASIVLAPWVIGLFYFNAFRL